MLAGMGTRGGPDIGALAAHAEAVGLESLWVPDHLLPTVPLLDSTLLLATAAAATSILKLGFGVMILAMRQTAWAAKQIATLQHLSGDRVLLGVGAGGEIHGDAGWRAAGLDYAHRGKLTDEALEILPALVRGEPVTVDGGLVELAPGATMPPVLIGGAGPAALRRAARFGDEWFPAFITPERLAAHELDGKVGITVSVSIGLGDVPASDVDRQMRSLTGYGMSEEDARRSMVVGSVANAAERYAALARAGATRVIGMPFTGDWRVQAGLHAEAVGLLGG